MNLVLDLERVSLATLNQLKDQLPHERYVKEMERRGMIAVLAKAQAIAKQFQLGEINALECERQLLEEGWTNVQFKQRGGWVSAMYLGVRYDLA